MESDKPSVTAFNASMLRAVHLILDGKPKIFEDKFALSFIGQEFESLIKNDSESFQTPSWKSARSSVLCRSKYTKDLLFEAISRGVKQYVILAAGLDSFAYQNTELSDRLSVFEVDYPASQRWKLKRIEEAGISLPKNVSFIPIDFECQSLEKGMAQSAYIPNEPTFFSWLGATYYLTRNTVLKTLQYVANSAARGSEIVFDYIFPESMLGEEESQISKKIKKSAVEIGEPIISTFRPDYMVSKLKEIGFNQIDEIDRNKVEDYNKKFFFNRTDGLVSAFNIVGQSLIKARI